MTSEVRAGPVPGPGVRPFQIADHNCFACGSLNRDGLGLALHVEPGRSWSRLALPERFEGWAGMAHGGIVCTILDEVMAWALVGEDNWGVTARLAVDFRLPVPIGGELHAEGWITRSRRRLVDTAATMVEAGTGRELATATATYLAASGSRKSELQARYGFRYVNHEAAGASNATEASLTSHTGSGEGAAAASAPPGSRGVEAHEGAAHTAVIP